VIVFPGEATAVNALQRRATGRKVSKGRLTPDAKSSIENLRHGFEIFGRFLREMAGDNKKL
jgi:hypothetical protein